MSNLPTPASPSHVVEQYLCRIEAHLVRLAEGHDPTGHLFGIERLARGARAEWSEAQRQTEHGRHRP